MPNQRSYQTLLQRVLLAGIPEAFFTKALVPVWMDDPDSIRDGLAELEISVARFLDTDVSKVRNPNEPLTLPEPFEFWVLPQVKGAVMRFQEHPVSEADERLVYGWLEYCESKLLRPEWFAQRYIYRVHPAEDAGYRGTCDEVPSLTVVSETQVLALKHITQEVLHHLTELYRTNQPMPQPRGPKPT